MTQPTKKNLLVNPCFEVGDESLSGWEWVVHSGRPEWCFDRDERHSGTRSVRIYQDGRSWWGELRQSVPCAGGARYRMMGFIKVAIEGNGQNSGATIYVRALAGGEQVGDLWHRPFFLGREGWRLWSAEYVTPRDADELVFSFDMRHSCGLAWFDDMELCEVPEPLAASVSLASGPAHASPPPRVCATASVSDDELGRRLAEAILSPLLGAGNVSVGPGGRDAAVYCGEPPAFENLVNMSRDRMLIVTPEAIVRSLGFGELAVETHESNVVDPCMRVEAESFLTRGFRVGDVVPWWSDPGSTGSRRQQQFRDHRNRVAELGFETVAVSACGEPGADGRPVLLWRQGGSGGGIAVMELDWARTRPTQHGEANLQCLVLGNALGRPQTTVGTYVAGGFDYERYCDELCGVADSHEGLELREEGSSARGLPIHSISLGPEGAPAFYVDCGIHADEWAPCFGSVLYAARLADELVAGMPWAKALLSELRLVVVPIVSPDGWDRNVRYLRRGEDRVDLNRNFPVAWEGFTGGFKGPAPFSEPETKAIRAIFEREKVVAAVNWHETTANTNWVGPVGYEGRYAKYAATVPGFFRQLIDGQHFAYAASTWTQIADERNFCWHTMDSYPYMRDYSKGNSPYECPWADSLGADGLTIEQYGNSDLTPSTSPQRTEITGRIIEMLFGLQIGLIARNWSAAPVEISIPVLCPDAAFEVAVYAADGEELNRASPQGSGGQGLVRTQLEAGSVAVVGVDPAPWQRSA